MAATTACRLHELHSCGIVVPGVVPAVSRTRNQESRMSPLVARLDSWGRAGFSGRAHLNPRRQEILALPRGELLRGLDRVDPFPIVSPTSSGKWC